MNNKVEQLNNVVLAMKNGSILPNENVMTNIENLNAPDLKIAFVGKFQTGKSHIINKLFLNGDSLLQEGNGLCMTAVSVAVQYGEHTQLTHINNNGNEIVTIQNPQPSDIAPLTAAEKSDARERIYRTIENVTLEYPNEKLKHVTIYDTPGIDDPNPELLRETTYRLLPEMDAVVMVVAPQSLSRAELRFLQKKVFAAGINRFMILISHKPGNLLNEEGLNNIVDEIKGQLEQIGKSEIPVLVYCEENEVPCQYDGYDVDSLILDSAADFSAANRYSKAKRSVEKQLREEIYKLGLQSAAYCKNQSERNLMKAEALKKLEEMKQTLDELQSDFNARMTLQRNNCVLGFQTDLADIRENFIKRLNEADGLAEAQEFLEMADETISQQIEDVAVSRIEQFHAEVEKSFLNLKANLRNHWKNETFDVVIDNVDGGRVQEWNATLLTLGDYILSTFLLPGGLLISIGLRFLLGKIPVLRDITPTNLLKGHMINVVNESLEQHILLICNDFKTALENAQNKVVDFLSAESGKEIDCQKSVIEAIDEQSADNDNNGNIEKIHSSLKLVGELLEQIS